MNPYKPDASSTDYLVRGESVVNFMLISAADYPFCGEAVNLETLPAVDDSIFLPVYPASNSTDFCQTSGSVCLLVLSSYPVLVHCSRVANIALLYKSLVFLA
ncbi:hypothetical protein TSMEX_006094 [Taenia solium]|eukprot:TsM_001185700 transcript=TsM_001185700 gene=TsM_001185700